METIGPQEGYHEVAPQACVKTQKALRKVLGIEKMLASFDGYYFLICWPSRSQPQVPPQPPRENVQPIATLEAPSC